MKTILTIFAISILTILQAQENYLGFSFGGANSNISSSKYFDDSYGVNSFHLGLLFEHRFSDSFSIETGLHLNQRGFALDVPYNTLSVPSVEMIDEVEYYFNYITIPAMVGYSLGNSFRVGVKGGFLASKLISAYRLSEELQLTEPDLEVAEELSDDANQFDFAATLGLEANLYIGNRVAIFGGVDVARSLNTFTNEDFFDQSQAKHFATMARLGLKFSLKSR